MDPVVNASPDAVHSQVASRYLQATGSLAMDRLRGQFREMTTIQDGVRAQIGSLLEMTKVLNEENTRLKTEVSPLQSHGSPSWMDPAGVDSIQEDHRSPDEACEAA